ncbi:MAG: nucleotidyltransferase [Lachnospiraceae bacterium]|nr:nucleotidyltransferase [Lachnospiraceae bacterium]
MRTTLLIMAAGLGSRYQKDKNTSSIKQLEPVGLHGELIIDYSIHDAIEAGFNRIIFVIRPDIEADFKERIGVRIEEIGRQHGVDVVYCFQKADDLPLLDGCPAKFPAGREKPWGTGQAVLAARDLIHEPFAVINADDYYGKEAFCKIHDWLVLSHAENAIAMAGFVLKNTLSDHGSVTRGLCKVAAGHSHVLDVVETGDIIKTEDGGASANGIVLNPDSSVSMNFWGFAAKENYKPWYMEALERGFADFFKTEVPTNPLKAEYLLPTHIGALLRTGKVTVKLLETTDKWFGVTYPEDKAAVVESIRGLIDSGVYEEELYSDL